MKFRLFLVFVFAGLYSCHTAYHPTSMTFTDYGITGQNTGDTVFGNYLKPFRDSMDKQMNVIVGTVAVKMDVKRPVTTLGNFLSDAYLTMARRKFEPNADISVMNLGGIRRPYIEAGPLTRGAIFEVMPFDNLLVLVKVNGGLLRKFLESVAAEGGGIAGMTMRVHDRKLAEVKIGGKPIDTAAEYILVTSDYAANNPNMQWFYGKAKRTDTPYLLRDAIEDYVKWMGREGKPIGEELENRIQIDN